MPIKVEISGVFREIICEFDTGAAVSVMSELIWKRLGSPNLKTSSRKLSVYSGKPLKLLGVLPTVAEYKGKYVEVKSEKQMAL